MICGILTPTKGRVAVAGTIAPLIELGAGFDAELSLVDNTLYYGLLLGIDRRTMAEHVDAILDFAELQEYRNEPVKTLSSGMTARLGFAIATEFRPDILILDEVLSVGDEAFSHKCKERLDHLWDEHVTILLVSHLLTSIMESCNRAIWLDHGTVVYDGSPHEAVLRYKLKVESQLLEGQARKAMLLLAPSQSNSKHANLYYAYFDGRRHMITSQEWVDANGLRYMEPLRLPDRVLDEIPEGEPTHELSTVAG
jgi:ABC-type polysaccharide/polyol phosphate transport system ATPase subunit